MCVCIFGPDQMSLDTGETFRSFMDSILLKPIGRAMANPLTLATMITFIVMIIVVYTYDEKHIFRTGLRVFGICTMFLFFNNHVLINDMNARQLTSDQQSVIRNLERGRGPNIISRPVNSHAATTGGYNSGGHNDGGYVVTKDDDDEDDDSDILEQLPDAATLVV